MRVNEEVMVGGRAYALRGLLLHSGGRPTAGHYVAVARHGEGSEPYFLYNDKLRVEVARSGLASSMVLSGGSGATRFYVAAMLCERVGGEAALVVEVVR